MNGEVPLKRTPLARFFGLALIVLGVLWLVFTGLCCVAVLVDFGATKRQIETVLLVGTISALIGAALYGIGRWLRPK